MHSLVSLMGLVTWKQKTVDFALSRELSKSGIVWIGHLFAQLHVVALLEAVIGVNKTLRVHVGSILTGGIMVPNIE